MRLLIIAFILISVVAATDSMEKMYPASQLGAQDLAVYRIDLTADVNGSIDYQTDEIYGKLYAVSWLNDTTSTINGTIYLNTTRPYVASLENYDLSGGNATEYTRTGSNMYFVSGDLTLDCDNATANQTMEVWLYLEQ